MQQDKAVYSIAGTGSVADSATQARRLKMANTLLDAHIISDIVEVVGI